MSDNQKPCQQHCKGCEHEVKVSVGDDEFPAGSAHAMAHEERPTEPPDPVAPLHTEYFGGEWRLPTDGPDPWAVITYSAEPSPETGHVGWCWWALGAMGDAASYEEARDRASAAIQRRMAPPEPTEPEPARDAANSAIQRALSAACEKIVDSALRAIEDDGDFASLHEAWAILADYADELWASVRLDGQKRSPIAVRREAIDIAAVAVRIAVQFGAA